MNLKIDMLRSTALMASVLLVLPSVSDGLINGIRGDLCASRINGRKYYIEAGNTAVLFAKNVTQPSGSNKRLSSFVASSSIVSFTRRRPSRRHRSSGSVSFVAEEGIQNTDLLAEDNDAILSLVESEDAIEADIGSVTSSLLSSISSPSPSSSSSSSSSSTMEGQASPALSSSSSTMSSHFGVSRVETSDPRRRLNMFSNKNPLDVTDAETVASAPPISQPFRCGLELFTCPDCHLEFTFEYINLPSCSHDQTCRCDYLRLREPPYLGASGQDVCSGGETENFATHTRDVTIDFLYTHPHDDAFKISIEAKKNSFLINGSSEEGTTGNVRSPFFPELYPKEYWMEYQFFSQDPNTRIQVVFQDFQVSPWSFVEIQDSNRSRVAVFNGNTFRPPVLVSSGPDLYFKFSANGETSRGFKMEYSFIPADSEITRPPVTDCGGFVMNFGGTITMMNMARDDEAATLYDCVWIIQPPQDYAFKSHLSIRVVQFEAMGADARLEVRQGLTSDDYLLEALEGSAKQSRSQEYVVAIDTGFYVRLRGAFTKDSKLAIVYSAFSYLGSCYSLTDLMCHNHRCVPKMLRCDGFDHCGDNSDEPTSCYGGPGGKTLTPEDAAWWYQHTPNYYFPQKNSIFAGQTSHGILLLVSLMVLVLVIVALISYMFKQSVQESDRRHERRERRERGHNRISSLSDGVEIFDAAADDPPVYEPPPDYEEVIKFILSGNNLKLVRRPGGVTAWVPDLPKVSQTGSDGTGTGSRPLRTRHASLDLENGVEVVLWNPNAMDSMSANGGDEARITEEGFHESGVTDFRTLSVPRSVPSPGLSGHVRRSSLPVASVVVTDMSNHSHGVSIAPESIPEDPEIAETLTNRSIITFDSASVFSSPGPSRALTPHSGLLTPALTPDLVLSLTSGVTTDSSVPNTLQLPRRTKSRRVAKKSGKRKKSSATRRNLNKSTKVEDSAPPSYEVAMQQAAQLSSERPSTDEPRSPSPSTSTQQISESTQTPLEGSPVKLCSPSSRIQAAREKFQRLSRGDLDDDDIVEEPRVQSVPKTVQLKPGPSTNSPRSKSHEVISTRVRRVRYPGMHVQARKAMLLKTNRQDSQDKIKKSQKHPHVQQRQHCHIQQKEAPGTSCNCQGACSCATLEDCLETAPSEEECFSPGMVRSKVQYYLAMEKSDVKTKPVPREDRVTVGQSTQNINQKEEMASNKRRRLVRNKSAPSLGTVACHRDLDIYFSPNCTPTEDLECPLLSSQGVMPKIMPSSKTQNDSTPSSHMAVSVKSMAMQYNDMSSDESSHRDEEDDGALSEDFSTTGEGNDGIISVRSMKMPPIDDKSIKPGIVKEATAKFMTALVFDMKPKLSFQDIDEWNNSIESPMSPNVPYCSFKDEENSTPIDIERAAPIFPRDNPIEMKSASPSIPVSGVVPKESAQYLETSEECWLGSNSSSCNSINFDRDAENVAESHLETEMEVLSTTSAEEEESKMSEKYARYDIRRQEASTAAPSTSTTALRGSGIGASAVTKYEARQERSLAFPGRQVNSFSSEDDDYSLESEGCEDSLDGYDDRMLSREREFQGALRNTGAKDYVAIDLDDRNSPITDVHPGPFPSTSSSAPSSSPSSAPSSLEMDGVVPVTPDQRMDFL
ncbi:uncharacterized protein LOC143034340 [Oratosquilla oratoria]|uniref:uncharacterized protein LOC143034340 n=1 Tax=Oratosquilla oratoria TaxID=337810 RepID=UPI003F76A4B7